MKNNTRIKDFLFTSESVSEGHPDKICDMVSDTIVDLYLAKDPMAKTAIETMAIPNTIIVVGEVRGPEISKEDIILAVRNTVKNIGYEQEQFHWEKINIDIRLNRQSPDIAMGVDGSDNKEEGAGDQGMMFGYACNETDDLMPAPIYYAHKILRIIFEAIHNGKLNGLGPDAKSQITIEYKDYMPIRADNIVVSIQHKEDLLQQDVRNLLIPYIKAALPDGWMPSLDKIFINPTGRFVIGGPVGDTGLTGRKIIVDTYGGYAPHGGGAFSGKDPSKVDRSGAYAARYLAKNIVASGLATKCTIQISYAIGVAKPLSLYANTHGTGIISEDKICEIINKIMDLRPKGIRTHLGLNKPIYKKTSAYGHFGRTPEADGHFSWEKLDLVDKIKKLM